MLQAIKVDKNNCFHFIYCIYVRYIYLTIYCKLWIFCFVIIPSVVSIEQPLKFGTVVVKLFDFTQLNVNQDDSTALLFLKASGLICFVFTSLNNVYMLICPNKGTAEFLQSNPDFIDSEEQEQKVECNKDTGGRKTLHCWSREFSLLLVLEVILNIGNPFTGVMQRLSFLVSFLLYQF